MSIYQRTRSLFVGKGSLISYLRKKVWALSLTAGNDGSGFQLNSTYSAFTVTIVLTKEGYRCLDKVCWGRGGA